MLVQYQSFVQVSVTYSIGNHRHNRIPTNSVFTELIWLLGLRDPEFEPYRRLTVSADLRVLNTNESSTDRYLGTPRVIHANEGCMALLKFYNVQQNNNHYY